jgi:tripeptide aminopeptidase
LELSKRVSGAITPVEFVSDERREVDARAAFLLQAGTPEELHRAREVLAALLHDAIAPGRSRGATVAFLQSEKVEDEAHFTNAALRSASLLSTFIESAKAAPLFPEESEGYEGYSNPCVIEAHGGTARVKFRLRAFSRDELALREEDVRRAALNEGVEAKVTFQYQNMGAVLARYPELVEWAVQAAQSIAVAARKLPIRGGTGVDPFLARGIPVANLGTGYFGLETEKELTSLQSMANHVLWYLNLLQIVGRTK